jgi:murein DD-endopeptidase MepM/ murein hydrolase activator NlpD
MATLSNPRGLATTLTLLVIVALVGGSALIWRQRVGGPQLVDANLPTVLGRDTTVDFHLRARGGHLSTLRVVLEQGDAHFDLFASDSLRTKEATVSARLEVAASGAKEGEARLLVYAGDDYWRPRGESKNAVAMEPVSIDLTPPGLQVRGATRYPEPGGSALAVLSAPDAQRCYVEVGDRRFPTHARGEAQVCLYAVDLDYDGSHPPQAVAEDAAGNRSVAELPVVIRAKPVPTGQVHLDRAWLVRTLPTLLGTDPSEVEADVGAAFRKVSVDLRAAAAAELESLATRSPDAAEWHGAFRQMPGSSVLSRFGVRRTYLLDGKGLDEKVHQGIDLASVRHAEIPAANDGRVVHAGPLTIYGNAVVVDHGLGLMTLYGHCSSLQVAVGDEVKKGQTLAFTGATGLAVGDHLHFEVLVGGEPVSPLQWLDGRWIDSHIEAIAREADVHLRDETS